MSEIVAGRSRDVDYEDLFENAPCGYLTTLLDGRITRTNAVFRNWTGYSNEELTSKRLHDILTIGTRILFETSIAPQLALNGSANEVSFDVRTVSGNILPVGWHQERFRRVLTESQLLSAWRSYVRRNDGAMSVSW